MNAGSKQNASDRPRPWLLKTPEATVYKSPEKVKCPTCGAEPQEPCRYLNGSAFRQTWHRRREEIPCDE